MLLKDKLKSLLFPLGTVIFAFLVAGIIVLLIGKSPVMALVIWWQGAFGSSASLATTLNKLSPLILTGLSVAFAFKAGLFNIGAEGQLYVGGITAAYVAGLFPGLNSWCYLPLALGSGIMAGICWGGIPGWLKAHRGAHEVITTIMMNYIAIYLTDYLVKGPFRGSEYITKTKEVLPAAQLGIIWKQPTTQVSVAPLLAIASAIIIYFLLKQTVMGYEIKAVGQNPSAAAYAGIPVKKNLVLAMGISGGLAGLAGAIEVLGVHHTFYAQFSPGYGYDGITAALLVANHPLGIIFSALLIAALRSGDRLLQLKGGIPRDIIFIIQGTIILMVGLQYFFSHYLQQRDVR